MMTFALDIYFKKPTFLLIYDQGFLKSKIKVKIKTNLHANGTSCHEANICKATKFCTYSVQSVYVWKDACHIYITIMVASSSKIVYITRKS